MLTTADLGDTIKWIFSGKRQITQIANRKYSVTSALWTTVVVWLILIGCVETYSGCQTAIIAVKCVLVDGCVKSSCAMCITAEL